MYQQPIRNDCSDIIISYGPTIQAQKDALREVYRIAKGGAIFFEDYNNELNLETWFEYTIRKIIADLHYLLELHFFLEY